MQCNRVSLSELLAYLGYSVLSLHLSLSSYRLSSLSCYFFLKTHFSLFFWETIFSWFSSYLLLLLSLLCWFASCSSAVGVGVSYHSVFGLPLTFFTVLSIQFFGCTKAKILESFLSPFFLSHYISNSWVKFVDSISKIYPEVNHFSLSYFCILMQATLMLCLDYCVNLLNYMFTSTLLSYSLFSKESFKKSAVHVTVLLLRILNICFNCSPVL